MAKRKSDSIRVSPKHGVNPSLGVCFWCGGETGEVVLAGFLPGDAEAPRKMVVSMEPCAKCVQNMGRGVTIIEAQPTPPAENVPPIRDGAYPTGRWLVLTPVGASKVFGGEWKENQKVLLLKEGFDLLAEEAKQAQEEESGR